MLCAQVRDAVLLILSFMNVAISSITAVVHTDLCIVRVCGVCARA